jgi:hypothetical protein
VVAYGRKTTSKFAARGRRPREEWIVAPDAHPALIDRETFERVGAVLTRNRTVQSAPRRSRFLLTSLAYCGRCQGVPGPGGAVRAWRIYGSGTKGPAYRCSRHDMYGLCDLPNLGAVGIDLAVRRQIAESFAITAEVRERAARFIEAEIDERRSAVDHQRRELERQLERHKRQRVVLARQFMGMAEKVIPEDVYRQLEAEEVDAISTIERTLASMPAEPPAVNVGPILDALSAATWDDLDFEDWRQVAILLIERVVIYGRDDFEIEWQPAAEVVRRALVKLSGAGSRMFG